MVAIPEPMVAVGYRPILWHVMKYYAHHGHKDFVLCLGYKANAVKEYFLNYNEAVSNDFMLSDGGRNVELLSSDIDDWRITFADTGLQANIGQRLKAVQRYLADEKIFLGSYGDCLTDAPSSRLFDDFHGRDKVVSFLSVPPTHTFYLVEQREDGLVSSIQSVQKSGPWINGDYFIFRQKIFDYIEESEELVDQPFQRLIKDGLLIAYPYEGFWAPMDTLRDRQTLEALAESGRPPWAVWQHTQPPAPVAGQQG